MQRIFVIGAGKSSTVLIRYLLDHAAANDWFVTVGDMSAELANQKVAGHPCGEGVTFNVLDDEQRVSSIRQSDLVISLLPANMHGPVAADCVHYGRNFISASYVSPEMSALHEAAVDRGVLLLNECGLDPGIDHMSAMRMIHDAQARGGVIHSFESYAGGLIAPESDNNPWKYKFTWNPRNIVLSGQGVARFYWKDQLKLIPYNKLFQRYDLLEVPGYGTFEGYPNRDSTKYKSLYGLDGTHTLVRGTLRKKGYCDAWNALVALGITDESYEVDLPQGTTWAQFIDNYLPFDPELSLKEKYIRYFHLEQQPEVVEKLEWLGLFSDRKLDRFQGSPARIFQDLLEDKWKLDTGDKDMIVMLHKMEVEMDQKMWEVQMSLAVCGDDEMITAMAKTVGLPLAITAKNVLAGKIQRTGVVIPVTPDIYMPILHELEQDFGISFIHEGKEI